jgi:hypothetical protein
MQEKFKMINFEIGISLNSSKLYGVLICNIFSDNASKSAYAVSSYQIGIHATLLSKLRKLFTKMCTDDCQMDRSN